MMDQMELMNSEDSNPLNFMPRANASNSQYESGPQVDLAFYEDMIAKFQGVLSTPLLNKRAEVGNDDPAEELIALHLEIKDLESQFQQSVEIGEFLIRKNKEVQEEYKTLLRRRQKESSLFERNRSSAINLDKQVALLQS